MRYDVWKTVFVHPQKNKIIADCVTGKCADPSVETEEENQRRLSMEDSRIIDLYWERSQDAVAETRNKYGRLIFSIAMKILRAQEDSEECENDTYLRAWNSMPPHRPDILSAFLGKITRNLALDRYEREHAQKRGGSQIPLILEELEECLPVEGGGSGLSLEMRDILNRFLEGQTEIARKIFVRRYWFGDSVKEIAQRYDLGESRVKMTLLRSRNSLRDLLETEGVSI